MRKTIKKLISCVLLVSVLLSVSSVFSVSFASNEEENKVYGKYEDSYIDIMDKLGIFEGLTNCEDEERPVKRWEFMAMCMNLTKSYLPANYEEVFVDVPSSLSYAPYVYSAYQKGWISLNDAKMFNPEDEITLEQAVKIIVKITGFDEKALSLSGYPSGYLDVAYQHNILNGIKISGNEKITLGATVKMFYNLFKAPFAYPVGVSEGLEYKYGEHTVFSYYHNLYKNTGIVTAVKNGTTGINSRILEDGKIEIDNEVYFADEDYANLLGKKVEFYYFSYENDDNKKILLAKETSSNKILNILKENIVELTDSFVLKYETPDGKIKEEKISKTVNVIYNNNYALKIVNYPKEEIKKADKVSLIDNNSDGEWDHIFIEKSELYYIDNVASESMYFNSLYSGEYITLENIPGSDLPLIYKNGSPATFSSIKKQNVAEVKKNYDNTKIISIDVVSNDVSGKVESVVTSSDEAFITVDGIEYKVHEVF